MPVSGIMPAVSCPECHDAGQETGDRRANRAELVPERGNGGLKTPGKSVLEHTSNKRAKACNEAEGWREVSLSICEPMVAGGCESASM